MTFNIPTGQLRINGKLSGIGYSGHGEAANDPKRVSERNIGPLPPGRYSIREWNSEEVAKGKKGPVVFELTFLPGQESYGRSAFLIHWDNSALDFSGSDGCVLFWLSAVFMRIRAAIAAGDRVLQVTL
jgi:hypothetical protein